MRKTYKYAIELSKPVWPRHIADEFEWRSFKIREAQFISVKDLQFKKHFYGNTYKLK
jgi:hypothetical protein